MASWRGGAGARWRQARARQTDGFHGARTIYNSLHDRISRAHRSSRRGSRSRRRSCACRTSRIRAASTSRSSACRSTAARRIGRARGWRRARSASQSSLIRPYSYFQKVAPFDRLNVADVGDVDAPPVSIEKCYEVGRSADRRDRRRRRAAARRRRRPLDLAADPARARARATDRSRWSSSTRTSTRGTSISAASIFTARRSAARSRKGSSIGERFIRSASAGRCTARTTSTSTASTASR